MRKEALEKRRTTVLTLVWQMLQSGDLCVHDLTLTCDAPMEKGFACSLETLMKPKPCMHFKYHVSFQQIWLIYFPILAWSQITLSRYLSNDWKINNPLLLLTRLTVPPGLYSLHLIKGPKSWPEEQQQNFTKKTFNKHFKFTFKMNKTLKIKTAFWIISQPPAP